MKERPGVVECAATLKRVLRSISDPVILVGREGHALLMNPAAEELARQSGLDPRSFIACRLLHGHDEDCRQGQHCPLTIVQRTMAPALVEHVHGKGSPHEKVVEVRCDPIVEPDGSFLGIVQVVRDLTAETALKRTIEKARREWQSTVDSVPDLILLASADGKILRCNRTVTQTLGRDYLDVLGRRVQDLLLPALDAEEHPGKAQLGERQIVGIQGWYEVERYPVHVSPDTSALVYVLTDVTEKREHRQILESEKELLQATLRSIGEGVISTDADDRVTLMNAKAEEITGWRTAEAVGTPLSTVYRTRDPKTLQALPPPTAVALEERRAVAGADRLLEGRDGRTRTVSDTASPIHGASGQIEGAVVGIRDVTAIRRLESIAASVDIMNNLGHVISSVRHEIGNPINAIKTTLAVLAERWESFPEAKRRLYVDRCAGEVARLEELLEQLRTLNVHSNLTLETIDLAAFLARTSRQMADDLAREGIRHAYSATAREGVHILGSKRALYQTLIGLVGNAIDAVKGAASPSIDLRLDHDESFIEIRVVDNGPEGIPPEDRETVFLPLYTTKPNGTGLGLAIARNTIVRMGGTIEVAARERAGTEFVIRLPRLPTAE